jgi:tetratricopeptide (TPR) repeat protein
VIPASVFVLIMLVWTAPGGARLGNVAAVAVAVAVLSWVLLRRQVNALVVVAISSAGLLALLFGAAIAGNTMLRRGRIRQSQQRRVVAPACALLLAACASTTAPPPVAVVATDSFDQRVSNTFTAEQWLNLSLEAYSANRYLESIAAAQSAARLHPDLAEAHNNMAAAYSALRLWDLAIPAAQEAIRLRPNFDLARNNLEWALEQKRLETQHH